MGPSDTLLSEPLNGGRTLHVNPGTGNLILEEVDASIAGTAGFDFELARTYNSFDREHVGDWGVGWRGPYGSYTRLWFEDAETVWYSRPGDGWSVEFVRDSNGDWQPQRPVDATLTENGDGTLRLEWHATGLVEHYDEPSLGTTAGEALLTGYEDRNGNSITVGRSEGRVTSTVDTQNRATSFARDGEYVTVVTDPAGREHVYDVDGQGRLVGYTNPDGQDTVYGWGGDELVSVTDAEGFTVEITYTSVNGGRLVASYTRVDPQPQGEDATTAFAYHADCGDTGPGDRAEPCTVVTDPRGNDTIYYTDPADGSVHTVVDALGRERPTGYSPTGKIASATNAHGQGQVTFHYSTDGNDNLTGASQDTGSGTSLTWSLEYDDADHAYSPTRYTAAQGTVVNYGYDGAGNLNCMHQLATSGCVNDGSGDPVAEQWSIDYHPDGTVQRMVDPNGNITAYTWTYNGPGQLTGLTIDHPAPRADEVISYDLLGRATEVDGVTYHYDVLDRVVQVDDTSSQPRVVYTYDAIGNQVEVTDPTGVTAWTYDHRGLVIEEDQHGMVQPLEYRWDGAGNLTWFREISWGEVFYSYDDIGRVTGVSEEPYGRLPQRHWQFDYDDDVDGTHDRKTITHPNGVVQTELVDQAGRLASIGASGGYPRTALTDFAYAYETMPTTDATPLRSSATDHTGATTSYAYDDLDRLVEAITRNTANTIVDAHAYAYDAAGNRTAWTHNATTTNYTYNAANQLTTAGGRTFTYNGHGHLTGDSDGLHITHNDLDQTETVRRDDTADTHSFAYRGATQYARTYNDLGETPMPKAELHSAVLGHVSTTGEANYTRTPDGTLLGITTWRIVNGGDREQAVYLHDGLGSIAAVVDEHGTVTNRYHYDPYGQTTTTCPTDDCVPNPFKYTGAHHDEATGLYKIGHRYYQPEHGRWTQPDPLGSRSSVGMPTEGHPYLYVGDNPVNMVDPTGLYSWEAAVTAGILYAIVYAVTVGITYNPWIASTVAGCLSASGGAIVEGASGREIALACAIGAGIGALHHWIGTLTAALPK